MYTHSPYHILSKRIICDFHVFFAVDMKITVQCFHYSSDAECILCTCSFYVQLLVLLFEIFFP